MRGGDRKGGRQQEGVVVTRAPRQRKGRLGECMKALNQQEVHLLQSRDEATVWDVYDATSLGSNLSHRKMSSQFIVSSRTQ